MSHGGNEMLVRDLIVLEVLLGTIFVLEHGLGVGAGGALGHAHQLVRPVDAEPGTGDVSGLEIELEAVEEAGPADAGIEAHLLHEDQDALTDGDGGLDVGLLLRLES